MKFKGLLKSHTNLQWTKGAYSVYIHERIGRYYLVKHDEQLAFKNVNDVEPDFSKWVSKWEKNAKDQINSLDDRIGDLKIQQAEFRRLLK